MEDISDKETIDSKYIILDQKGDGATSDVYLVREINKQEIYAAKVMKNKSIYFENEIKILNILKPINHQNIINLKNSGEGLIIKKDEPKKSSQYLVLENCSKGDLLYYILYPRKGFSELHSKFIFSKILNGVEICQKNGICHRDLKTDNILLDANFCPKICDFGYATNNSNVLTESLGTYNYEAPEVLRGKKYDGFAADIFSLGVVLITLNTFNFGFEIATIRDEYYQLIIRKKIDDYWGKFGDKFNDISKELKDLYIKMVSYNPKDRPTIEEIFNSEWMKEIREMNDKQLAQLEDEVKKEFIIREPLVVEGLRKEKEGKNQNQDTDKSSGNRSFGDENEEFFDLNLKPKYAQSGLNMVNYIKITGNLNPGIFMNSVANKIIREYKNEGWKIVPFPDEGKFNVIIEKGIIENEIPEDIKEELIKLGIEDIDIDITENKNIKGLKTVIQINIYESFNGGYLLRFVKKEGDLYDYLNNIEKICALIN